MGSVLVGRMILEAILHRLRKRESWGGCSPPICLHDGFLKQFWLMVRRSRKQICAAQKRKAGELGGGGCSPPHCTHDVFITRSERGHMGSVVADRMILAVAL